MRKLRIPIATRIVGVAGVSLGIFAVSMLSVVRRTVARAMYAEIQARVEVAQKILWDAIDRKGPPSLFEGRLRLGNWDPANDHALVDRVKSLTGADATLFQIDNGTPIRISTTVGRLDGSGRNVGTELAGPAREAFERGESYVGVGIVAGRDFINHYDALRDGGGAIVGLLYTGVPLQAMHAAAAETMRVVVTGTVIALLPSLTALYLITRPVARTFLQAVQVAQGLAQGNVEQFTHESFLDDEIGDVNSAFGKMIDYQQRMASIADAIAQGDLSNDVLPASSVDRLGIAFARMTENLRALVAQLETTARTDTLTQLGNRRAFDDRLASELSRTARHGGILSLAIVDVDDFKNVNDRQGHQAGDAVLVEIARLLGATRQEDSAFRLGGDEFALILPDTSAAQGKVILDRVRTAAEAKLPGVTISAGVAASNRGLTAPETLQREADSALYLGKQRGRNLVVVHPSALPQPAFSQDGAPA